MKTFNSTCKPNALGAVAPSVSALRWPNIQPALRRAALCRANSESAGLSVDELLAQANALLDQAASKPGGSSSGVVTQLLEEEESEMQMQYVCDESGCVVVYPDDEPEADAAGGSAGVCISGEGWKVDNASDVGSIAGPEWDIQVASADVSTFIEVLQRLSSVVSNLAAVGEWTDRSEDRPSSKVKWESGKVFMQATYSTVEPQPSFAVEFTISSSEGQVESGFWPARIVKEVLANLSVDSFAPADAARMRASSPIAAQRQAQESGKVPSASIV